jgi:hypothetical protein
MSVDLSKLHDRGARYADLMRRRADVYASARGDNPYYGDDDIDLLRSLLDEARADAHDAEVCYARELSRLKATIVRLRASLKAEDEACVVAGMLQDAARDA